MINWEAEAGVFPLSRLSSKFSVSDVFLHFILGLKSELILQFFYVPARILRRWRGIHLGVGSRGGLGRWPENNVLM